MTYITGPIAIDFEDISTSGTAVSLDDDEMSRAIAMPFSFKFFGVTYRNIFIRLIGDLICLEKMIVVVCLFLEKNACLIFFV